MIWVMAEAAAWIAARSLERPISTLPWPSLANWTMPACASDGLMVKCPTRLPANVRIRSKSAELMLSEPSSTSMKSIVLTQPVWA